MSIAWFIGIAVVVLPLLRTRNAFGTEVGTIVAIAWTVGLFYFFGKYGTAEYHEKVRWERQEATRLRKNEWREGAEVSPYDDIPSRCSPPM